MTVELAGRVALVTGAASGIGHAIATRLARAGARVYLCDMAEEPGRRAAENLAADGLDATFVPLDVTSAADWSRAFERLDADDAELDILINNAGMQRARDIEHADARDLRDHLRVNLGGLYMGTMRAIDLMSDRPTESRARPAGVIVNIISTYGIVGEEFNAAYCASKGAARAVTESAARLCRNRGFPIRVHAVHPGCCITPLVEREHRETMQQMTSGDAAALWEEWRLEHPIGRLGTADDIAGAVLFLASDGARRIATLNLPVDGGYLAQ